MNEPMIDFDKFHERYKKEREIRCPHCDHLLSNDDCQYPITYHGSSDNGYVEKECPECGEQFFVDEMVSRTYRVAKTEEELDV